MGDEDLRKLQAESERLNDRLAELEDRPAGRRRGLLARAGSSPRLRLALVATVVGLAAVSYAAQISVPYSFTNGTVADADEVNADFGALVTESNSQDSRITTVEGDLTAHEGDSSAHHPKTTDASELTSGVLSNARLALGVDTNAADDVTIGSTAGGDLAGTYPSPQVINDSHTHDARYYTEGQVDGLVSGLDSRITALEGLLADVSRGGTPDTLTFSGMNVQVVSGSGSTAGTINGRGNLIVGYNENTFSATRTGSHNLVVGKDHEYTNYAGLVAGWKNTVSGPYSSVSGGNDNTASGTYASVSGGKYNTAISLYSSVSGGYNNTASGTYASVSGGSNNTASVASSSVSGGYLNEADGINSSVSGGFNSGASGNYSSVSGGYYNEASGNYSSVSGGYYNYAGNVCSSGSNPGARCLDDGQCTGGGTCGTNLYQAVGAGGNNEASGEYSSVSGGYGNSASRSSASISGGNANEAAHTYASVSGGVGNTAGAYGSSVSGGASNTTSSTYGVAVGISTSEYTASATSATPVTTNTPVKEHCALTYMSLQTGDAGTYKFCEITQNGDDTWTLTARGGSTSANVNCKAVCY